MVLNNVVLYIDRCIFRIFYKMFSLRLSKWLVWCVVGNLLCLMSLNKCGLNCFCIYVLVLCYLIIKIYN